MYSFFAIQNQSFPLFICFPFIPQYDALQEHYFSQFVQNFPPLESQTATFDYSKSSLAEQWSEPICTSQAHFKLKREQLAQNIQVFDQKQIFPIAPKTKLEFQETWNNERRNIIPNIVNQIFSFLEKSKKSGFLLNKIMAKIKSQIGFEYSAKKFYFFMKFMKMNSNHYKSENLLLSFLKTDSSICGQYTIEEQVSYLQICRILIMHFLRSESMINSLTSSRMNQGNRRAHLKARRALLRFFLSASFRQF